MRALISHVLRAQEIDVVEAVDAEEALARWREFRPDVIVLDQQMPPTSGLDLAKEILADEPGQVIFLFTALIDAEIRAEAARLGIVSCISKDQVFELPDLVRGHLSPG
jgi:CheY-like chemotaxis protein